MADMISRVERSFELVKASWDVLRSDGELLVLPLLSTVATIVVVGGFVLEAMSNGTFDAIQANQGIGLPLSVYAWLFAMYMVQYFVIIFFNTALVGAALERLEGGDPTVRSALTLALRRIGPIFGYAVVSATIGVVLRALAERLGFVGRLVEAGAGLAWTVATFLVVPVLAAEGVGPFEAIERSAALLKKTWGENIIGNAGISLALGIGGGLIGFVGIGGGSALYDRVGPAAGIPVLSISIALLVALALIGSALASAYAAAVYYYAITGSPPRDFDRGLIRDSFAPKDA